jgi:hypothetical protein
MNLVNRKYRKTFFPTLINNIITLIVQCDLATPNISKNALAQSSILNCYYALETASNCLLEYIAQLDPFTKKNIVLYERNSTFFKFKYGLNFFKKIELPDDKYTNSMKELLIIRNELLHSKVSYGEIHKDEKWGNLKIPKNEITWDHKDAKKVANLLFEFLDRLFSNHLGFSKNETNLILSSYYLDKKQGDFSPVIYTPISKEAYEYIRVKKEWNPKIDFINDAFVWVTS